MRNVETSTKVGSYVETQEVDHLLLNYKKTRWVANSEKIGKPDSLSSWYTLNEMQEFLEKAATHGANGLKLYFGTYPKDFKKKPEYSERQTVVLVPTKSSFLEDGSRVDKHIYINSTNGIQILAYNVGRLCPPMCGGGIGEPIEWEIFESNLSEETKKD